MSNRMNEFMTIKQQYDAESELMAELEKKPLSEGQVKDMMTRGYNDVDAATNLKRFNNLIGELKSRGLVIKDSPVSYADFKKANTGSVVIKISTYRQMELDELRRLKDHITPSHPFEQDRKKQLALYDDSPLDIIGQGGENIHHYKYSQNRVVKITGSGWRTVLHLLPPNPTGEDLSKANAAARLYNDARAEIKTIFDGLGLELSK